MAIREKQNAIRLMIISLYFLFMLPGILAARRFTLDFSISRVLMTFGLGMIVVFFLLETVEFSFFRYRYASRRPVLLLFFVRVALLAVHVVLYSKNAIPLRHNPVLSTFFPLLIFYTYFAFPFRFSLPLSLLMVFVPGVAGLFNIVPDGGGRGPDALSFLVFRAVVGCFFYALAWLWDTERRRNDENQRLMQDLHESERRLRDFAGQVGHTVALEERTRIARDLHDSLGHALTAIKIQLRKAEAYFTVNADEAQQAIAAAHETAADAMSDVRESLGRLNGESGIDLESAISRLTRQLEQTGHAVALTFVGESRQYNYAVLLGLYRCVQEGITNILKHAGATEVAISVTLGPERGMIEIRDNGRGCTVRDGAPAAQENIAAGQDEGSATHPHGGEHYGFRGLQRRLELVGGAVELISTPGNGAVLRASAPRDPLKLIGRENGRENSSSDS